MKTTIILLLAAASLNAQSVLVTNPETPEQATARAVVQNIQQTKQVIIGQLRHSNEVIWKSPNPQGALDILGPRAGEVFALNTAIMQFCAQLLTQAGDAGGLAELERIAAMVPPHTINPDGTVTITTNSGNGTLSGNQTTQP